jgi:hypothetical protein
MLAGGALLLLLQLATALPYHPYYFTYFNPLIGGGPVAAQLTRVGWGEGMDQVAAYLQSLDEPESLVVASRFFHYLLGFKGQRMNLSADGDWVRADKIIFYIQQTQRMLDPSPGVIRYFERHVPPEKVITINGIDYAWIYPNPIQYPANPLADRLEGGLSLLGYRWETAPEAGATIRLIWENLSPSGPPLAVRLWSNQADHSDWLPCSTLPGFETAAQTPGELVESACPLAAADLPPGLYDLQVGLQQPDSSWQTLEFSAGWSAVEKSRAGGLQRVTPEIAFARLAAEAVPPSATRLDHTYAGRVRLLAYELEPVQVRPGQPLAVTLYWQAVRVLEQDAHASLQLFLPNNEQVALVNGPPLENRRPTTTWRPGEVLVDRWTIELPAELPVPALLRLDVSLFLPDTLITLPIHNSNGEAIPGAIADIRVEPEAWPAYQGDQPLDVVFDQAISLIGYETKSGPEPAELEVTLYWRSLAPLPGEALTAFVHLLGPEGELAAQSDLPPAGGHYPTWAWQPDQVILSRHRLTLPQAAAGAGYRLVAGLYRPTGGMRLAAQDGRYQPLPDNAAPLGFVALP